MKILVTGAAGSLGKNLIEKLLKDPALLNQLDKGADNSNKETSPEPINLYATDIKPDPFTHLMKSAPSGISLTYRCIDLCSAEFTDWVETIKPNKIVHLASILQISAKVTREMAYQVDVTATKKLLETSVKIGVDKFIITTSGAAYGYYPENVNEITEERPTRGNSDYFYSAHKAEIEDVMASYREQHPELQQIVFRPGTILGPNFEGPIVNFFDQKMITGVMGYPGPFNFIWSEDVVDYLIEGLTSTITGQFNIAGDGTLTVKRIAETLEKFYLPLPALVIQTALFIAKPLGLTQYGPEQVKFIKYRPVLNNSKIKNTFVHQPKYNSWQALSAYLASQKGKV